MYIINDPKAQTYKKLLDIAFEYSDSFILVINKDLDTSKNLINVMNKLKNSLIEMKEESEWPSTKLWKDNTAYIYYYKTTSNAKEILENECNSLFGWLQPELPEDLCFFKDKKCWMATCSHEDIVDFYIEDVNLISKLTNVSGLDLSLIHI